MKCRKSILIVDDNRDFCEKIKEFLSSSENFYVAGMAHDGKTGYDMILETKPDLLLTDVVMPRMDGLALINKINNSMHISQRPKVIVFSSTGGEYVIENVMKRGAEFYMLKPFDMCILEERINELFTDKENTQSSIIQPESVNRDIETNITMYIQKLGVPANVKGYHYIRNAIMIAIENMDSINSITKILYPSVAKRYKTTSSGVERAIRHAIEIAWNRGDPETLNGVFGYNVLNRKVKPTNSEFIAMIADRIRLELKAS